MGKKNHIKNKAARKARKKATPKTDAARGRRVACGPNCVPSCQSDHEDMLKLAGRIESMGGRVEFWDSSK